MASNYYPMVDAFPQIKAALEALPDNPKVTATWPRAERRGPLIVVTEIGNSNTNIRVVDQLSYQLDVWADDGDVLRRLCADADAVMADIGFRRTLAQPEDDSNGFLRVFRYSRKVDKRFMRLID